MKITATLMLCSVKLTEMAGELFETVGTRSGYQKSSLTGGGEKFMKSN